MCVAAPLYWMLRCGLSIMLPTSTSMPGHEDVLEHTLFVITTDGMESASRSYSAQWIKETIQRQKEKHGWGFFFL